MAIFAILRLILSFYSNTKAAYTSSISAVRENRSPRNHQIFLADTNIIFFILKAMAQKAKSIVTLSLPKWQKQRYAMLDFICPKPASGSMHRRPRCLSPASDVSSSRAYACICSGGGWPRLYAGRLWPCSTYIAAGSLGSAKGLVPLSVRHLGVFFCLVSPPRNKDGQTWIAKNQGIYTLM